MRPTRRCQLLCCLSICLGLAARLNFVTRPRVDVHGQLLAALKPNCGGGGIAVASGSPARAIASN